MNNSNRQPALVIKGVSKKYKLGLIGGRTLQEELQSWWAKKRGKEDPNIKIGINQEDFGKDFWALKDIDLTIYKGERIGIIGSNGAGKSTLLKLLSQVTAPTEGDIYLYGKISSMLEVGTGFHGEMTGRENVYLNGAILGMTTAEIEEKMEDIIEFSEVEKFIDTPVKRYSSGMFVKLAFSVAAHLNSEIMIMDEVLAVGDYAFQKKCLKKMRDVADDQGRTILYVSHNMETIRNLCERCVVLKEGKIIYDGDVEEAIALYVGRNTKDTIGVNIDLSTKTHYGNSEESGLLMKQLRFNEKELELYGQREPLNMSLYIHTTKPLENIKVKMDILNISSVHIGTTWSKEVSITQTGDSIIHLSFPLDFIKRGRFLFSMGVYQQEGEKLKRLDSIDDAFFINFKTESEWLHALGGFLELPPMEVVVEQK